MLSKWAWLWDHYWGHRKLTNGSVPKERNLTVASQAASQAVIITNDFSARPGLFGHHLKSMLEFLTGLILYKSCHSNHICCECICSQIWHVQRIALQCTLPYLLSYSYYLLFHDLLWTFRGRSWYRCSICDWALIANSYSAL